MGLSASGLVATSTPTISLHVSLSFSGTYLSACTCLLNGVCFSAPSPLLLPRPFLPCFSPCCGAVADHASSPGTATTPLGPRLLAGYRYSASRAPTASSRGPYPPLPLLSFFPLLFLVRPPSSPLPSRSHRRPSPCLLLSLPFAFSMEFMLTGPYMCFPG